MITSNPPRGRSVSTAAVDATGDSDRAYEQDARAHNAPPGLPEAA